MEETMTKTELRNELVRVQMQNVGIREDSLRKQEEINHLQARVTELTHRTNPEREMQQLRERVLESARMITHNGRVDDLLQNADKMLKWVLDIKDTAPSAEKV